MMKEYQMIKKYYDSGTTRRSGIKLINHIDEGLIILDKIEASDIAKRAYCLHPIVQSDECLSQNYSFDFQGIDPKVLIVVIEYRSVANEYLSIKKINTIDDIRLSPLKDVNDMLIADKIQNRKDYELYHKETHPRSIELDKYFKNWLQKLNIDESFYQETITMLKKESEL
ncbi:hypothetical protein [Aquimarina macrocephali]|uniref:hypothetical protein n=1 Tax=Aquimarina macrocephali TaxID=666563 RepID=UPI0012695B44|nr:hypothetical protein [Aquimarina macrocephali]